MWVKVCGVRDLDTAFRLAELDVDAIGLNFYSGSSRNVSVDDAIEICQKIPRGIDRVGVFVNHAINDVERIINACQLDFVQLHGDEPASYLLELRRRMPKIRLIRAWRMGDDGLNALEVFLSVCRTGHCELAGCLVDAHVTGVFGGSGKTVPWERLAGDYLRDEWPQLVLAGGLTAKNVGEAIAVIQPWGVDVASGVELSPGIKDFDLVQEFVNNARSAIQRR